MGQLVPTKRRNTMDEPYSPFFYMALLVLGIAGCAWLFAGFVFGLGG